MRPCLIRGGAVIVYGGSPANETRTWPLDPAQILGAERSRRLDPLSQMALVAVQMATRDAGLSREADAPIALREGVVVGTALGATVTSVRYAKRLVVSGPAATNPIDFPDSIDGSAAAHVALDQRLGGPSLTFTDGRESAVSALVFAARLLASGRADRMIVVAGDVLDPLFEVARCGSHDSEPRATSGVSAPQCVGAWVLDLESEAPNPHGAIEFYGATSAMRYAPAGGSVRSPDPSRQDSDPAGALELAAAWLGAKGPRAQWLGEWAPSKHQGIALPDGRRGFSLASVSYPHLLLVAPAAESITPGRCKNSC